MIDKRHLSGHAAELFVAAKIAEQGYTVSMPLLTQSRYDFVVEIGGIFWSFQIKKATWSKSGKYSYLQARLSRDKIRLDPQVDYFAFTDLKDVWIIEASDLKGKTSVCLASDKPGYIPRITYDWWKL